MSAHTINSDPYAIFDGFDTEVVGAPVQQQGDSVIDADIVDPLDSLESDGQQAQGDRPRRKAKRKSSRTTPLGQDDTEIFPSAPIVADVSPFRSALRDAIRIDLWPQQNWVMLFGVLQLGTIANGLSAIRLIAGALVSPILIVTLVTCLVVVAKWGHQPELRDAAFKILFGFVASLLIPTFFF